MLKYCILTLILNSGKNFNFESFLSRVAKLEDIKFKDRTDLICDSQLFEKGELRIIFFLDVFVCGWENNMEAFNS